ncbi:hypothetical protein P4O66_000295 [Electrophorus voltai]|uniref:Uromodulin-like 1 n=1 Tax=Electrophorus voltai TaxID=2609070 RepID=A0AAD8ZL80_9TELE|nr:hypothetical protein P4O66_000295 [Electrophorus voltai]
MGRFFCTWFALTLFGLAKGHNTFYEGYDLALSGYHLCTVTELVAVNNVVSSTSLRTETRPCGGWLPWRMCNVARYTTTLETQIVHIPKQVKKCCEDYEQLGSYCALSLNRSAEFTAKPGRCPAHPSPAPSIPCEWDTDCPGWQKCCPSDNLTQCVDPHTHVFQTEEMLALHVLQVSGALSPAAVSVFHVLSWPAGLFSTSSTLLLASTQSLSSSDISNRLQHLLLNIEEVTAIDVSDVDECSIAVLRECSPQASCTNTQGSYNCTCPVGSTDQKPSRPGTQCGDTSSSSGVLSNTNLISIGPLLNSGARAVVFSTLSTSGATPNAAPSATPNTTGTTSHPLANNLSNSDSHMYAVGVQTLQAKVRLTSVSFTQALLRDDSEEYHNLSQRITKETVRSLPPDILQLVLSGMVRVSVTGLSPGSVVAKLSLIFQANSTKDIMAVALALMESLQNSSQFSVDRNSTLISGMLSGFSLPDVNECLYGPADCSPWADCENIFGSFTCTCFSGYTDADPSRPGRTCQARSNETASSSDQLMVGMPTQPAIFNTLTVSTDSTVHPSPQNFNVTTAAAVPDTTTIDSTSSTVSSLMMGNTLLSSSTTSLTPSTNQSSTSVSPSTTAWTVTPVIQASAPIVSHTEAISVECRLGFITVSVARDFLQLRHISEASLYLGQPMCGQSDGNSTHVKLTMAWNDCGALVFQDNSQNTTIQVKLYNNFTQRMAAGSEDVAPTVQLEVPIICTYVKRITISTGNDLTGFVALVGDAVMGIGTFPVTVRLLNGTSPLPQNYTLSPKDEVIIEVRVNSTVPQIKVVINKCWANPTANPSTTPVYVFLENSCPVPDSYTTVLQNGNSTTSLVAVNIFSLVDLSVIFLHCQIQICIETPLATCRAVRALSLY